MDLYFYCTACICNVVSLYLTCVLYRLEAEPDYREIKWGDRVKLHRKQSWMKFQNNFKIAFWKFWFHNKFFTLKRRYCCVCVTGIPPVRALHPEHRKYKHILLWCEGDKRLLQSWVCQCTAEFTRCFTLLFKRIYYRQNTLMCLSVLGYMSKKI